MFFWAHSFRQLERVVVVVFSPLSHTWPHRKLKRSTVEQYNNIQSAANIAPTHTHSRVRLDNRYKLSFRVSYRISRMFQIVCAFGCKHTTHSPNNVPRKLLCTNSIYRIRSTHIYSSRSVYIHLFASTIVTAVVSFFTCLHKSSIQSTVFSTPEYPTKHSSRTSEFTPLRLPLTATHELIHTTITRQRPLVVDIFARVFRPKTIQQTLGLGDRH